MREPTPVEDSVVRIHPETGHQGTFVNHGFNSIADASGPEGVAPRFHWFLPVRGDSRDPGVITAVEGISRPAERTADLEYLTLAASAAERAGFQAVLTPVGLGCPDPWIICTAVAARTSRIRFIVALRPAFGSPTLIAQQADAFTKLFGPRLILNIVTGGDAREQAAYGDHSTHDQRYERTAEWLRVIRPLLAGKRVTVSGDHLHVVDAALSQPSGVPVPIYLGGASPAAVEIAVEQVDTYLVWGEPPVDVAERIAHIRQRAAARDRTIRIGLRIHVIARDTAVEAWAEADRMLGRFDPAAIAAVQERFARMDSHGQARMTALHSGSTDPRDLVVAPNLWAGIGLVREGVATALVGSHDEIADRLVEYLDLGVDEFILSGYPHLEESLRVGENVLPRVRRRVAGALSAV